MTIQEMSAIAIEVELDAFVDAVFDRPNISIYGRIDVAEFEEAKAILKGDDVMRRRYALATVSKIVNWEQAFRELCDAFVEGGPATPDKQNPAKRATVLAHLLTPLFRRRLDFTRDELLSILQTMNREAVLSEHRFPVIPLAKHLNGIDVFDDELRQAALDMCARVSAGYTRHRTLKAEVTKLAAKLAIVVAPVLEPRQVLRGFTGHPYVLRELKIKAQLVEEESAPPCKTVGLDRFPLRADSILVAEHAVWSDLLDDWNALPDWGRRNLPDSDSGQNILAHAPAERGRLLLALAERLVHQELTDKSWEDEMHNDACAMAGRCFQSLMDVEWSLPRDQFFDAVLAAALARVRFYSGASGDAFGRIVECAERFHIEVPLSDPERYALSLLRVAVIEGGLFGRDETMLGRLSHLTGDESAGDVLAANENWVQKLHARIAAFPPDARLQWRELLLHAKAVPAGKPNDRWIKAGHDISNAIGVAAVTDALIECFHEFALMRHDPIWNFTFRGHSRTGFIFGEPNSSVLKRLGPDSINFSKHRSPSSDCGSLCVRIQENSRRWPARGESWKWVCHGTGSHGQRTGRRPTGDA